MVGNRALTRTTRLDACHSISDLRALAQIRLPAAVFDFLDGAAESESSARTNLTAFDRDALVPKCLVDVSSVTTATRVLGQDLEWPLICAPTGASRLFHPEGELAVARASAAAGTLYGLATGSTCSLEDVAVASAGAKLFQLYIFKDRAITWNLIERAKLAGYEALCVTVDAPVSGKRERDLRSGFTVPPRLSIKSLISFIGHPNWALGQMRHGSLTLPNITTGAARSSMVAQSRHLADQLDPSVTWKDVREIIARWAGPFALKGIMAPDDAKRAVDLGTTAVIVSNHGGRQLDGAVAAFDALPAIANAVGGQAEIILDGGIRRGSHILKALARGAKACSIGRPYLYGLGAGGEAGVRKALEILRTELVLAMRLSGCPNLGSIGSDMVRSMR